MSMPTIPSPPRRLLAPTPLTHLLLLHAPHRLLSALVAIIGGIAIPFSLASDIGPLGATAAGLPFVAGGALYLAWALRNVARARTILRTGDAIHATVETARRVRGRAVIVLRLADGHRTTLRFQPRPLRPREGGGWEVDAALAGRLMRFDPGSASPLELTALVDPSDNEKVVLPQLLGVLFDAS